MCDWASGLRARARGLQLSQRTGWKWASVWVCVYAQRWAHRREKNLWKQSHDSWGGSMCEACLFCIYPLWCSCVHCPFPRTPEHSRRPHGPSSVQPPSRSTGAPLSLFARDVPIFRYSAVLSLLRSSTPAWAKKISNGHTAQRCPK